MKEPEKAEGGFGVLGFVIVCLCIIAIIGCYGALAAFVDHNYVGGAICLIASALPLSTILFTLMKKT